MQPKPNTRFARVNEAERVQNVLNEWIAAPLNAGGLTVLGVSGYGGVGKSFLLNSVLNEKKLESRDALVIIIDGGKKRLLTDFMGFVDEKLAPKVVRFKGSNPKDDQFPETRKLVSHQRKLAANVIAEVEASDPDPRVRDREVRLDWMEREDRESARLIFAEIFRWPERGGDRFAGGRDRAHSAENVIARFQLERQALTTMEHLNIARVLHARETGSGRP